MLSLHFLEQERERIARLPDDRKGLQKWQEWWEHYQKLAPKERAAVRYILVAARKDGVAEGLLGEEFCPIWGVDANDGRGIMFVIDRDFFLCENVKLFYVRSDMRIPSRADLNTVPEWITDLAENCRKYSRGLVLIQPEIISYSFDEDSPGNYYAITFHFGDEQICKLNQMEDAYGEREKIEPYMLAIMDMTGEYDYAIGELSNNDPIVLWQESMDCE